MRLACLLVPLLACVSDAVGLPDGGSLTDVNGTVVDEFGTPVDKAIVQVLGEKATATTVADGKFALKARTTYDIVTVFPSTITSVGMRATAFLGIDNHAPRLQVVVGQKHKGILNVTLTGGTIAATNRVVIAVAAAQADVFNGLLPPIAGQMGTFPAIEWFGAAQLSGTIYALEIGPTNPFPTAFGHYGSSTGLTVPDGASGSASIDVTRAVVSVGMVTGKVVFDAPWTHDGFQALYRPASDTNMVAAFPAFIGPDFAVPTPLDKEVLFKLGVVALAKAPPSCGMTCDSYAGAWRQQLVPGQSGVDLTFPKPLLADAPVAGATGLDAIATDFKWTSPQPAAFNLNLHCGPAAQPIYDVDVFTMQPTARIPDTKALGLAFPSGTSCEWFAYSFTGIGTADLLVGPAGWRQYAVAYRAASDGWFTRSGNRTFTTK